MTFTIWIGGTPRHDDIVDVCVRIMNEEPYSEDEIPSVTQVITTYHPDEIVDKVPINVSYDMYKRLLDVVYEEIYDKGDGLGNYNTSTSTPAWDAIKGIHQ